MPIRWKVVTKDRESWSMLLRPEIFPEKFVKIYNLNTIVSAHPKSLGLMTFKTKKHAKKFQSRHPVSGLRIIKVKGIGRGYVPKAIVALFRIISLNGILETTQELKTSGYSRPYCSSLFWSTPVGTICYKKVKVLT